MESKPKYTRIQMRDIKALVFFKKDGILLLAYGISCGPLQKSHLCPCCRPDRAGVNLPQKMQ